MSEIKEGRPPTPDEVRQYRTSAAIWRMECAIYEGCITLANRLITQLDSSHGDHSDDIEDIETMIATWKALHISASESAKLNERWAAKGDGHAESA